MPLIDLGAGATTSNTTRAVAATNSPEVVTLGATADLAPVEGDQGATTDVIALLKGLLEETRYHTQLLEKFLSELRRLRVSTENMDDAASEGETDESEDPEEWFDAPDDEPLDDGAES